MNRISHIVFFTVLCFLSCKEDKPKPYCEENPGQCQSVLEAKKFFAFKVGSWWVYEEETSGERDSMYVTEGNNDYTSYDFDTRIESALTGYEYHYWPVYSGGNSSCSKSSPVQEKCLYIKRSKGKPEDYIGEAYCFFVNYRVGDYAYISGNIYFENNKIIVSNIFSTYSVQNITFHNVVEFHELSTRVEGIQPTNHFYSENVGLVRKELLDSNEVWNLVNYHIEP